MTDPKKPHVSIIVLNWNNPSMTGECLDSLAQLTYANRTIIVVNNGSTDNSSEFIATNYPWVKLIDLPHNLGFTGGNNVGIEYALTTETDYILLVNNDIVVDPELVSELVRAVDNNPRAGMACCKIYLFDSPDHLWYGGGKVSFWMGARHIGIGQVDGPQYSSSHEVTFVSGCCFFVRRTIIDTIGGLDDLLFSYSEDLDWCFKVRKQGYCGLYVPSAKMWHKVGTDWKRNKGKQMVSWLATRNLLIVYARHLPKPLFTLFLVYFIGAWGPYKTAIKVLSGKWQESIGIWKGVYRYFVTPDSPTKRRRIDEIS